MRKIASRKYRPAQDRDLVADLLISYRVDTSVLTYPTLWRLRLLLSSRVSEPELDIRIWEDNAGQMVALAMLWRRYRESTYLVLERFVRPSFATDQLVRATLQWGTERSHAIVNETGTAITLYASQLLPAVHSDDSFNTLGFKLVAPDPSQYNMYFGRSLRDPLPEPTLPAGHTIRPLQSSKELDGYQALYDFAAVCPEHRQEMLASDEYGHLVVEDANAALVAYCEYSICREEWRRSGRNVGWIDYIGTQEGHRSQGLAKAVLLRGLQQLREWDCETAMLVTASTNIAATRLYRAAGFVHWAVEEPPCYELPVVVA